MFTPVRIRSVATIRNWHPRRAISSLFLLAIPAAAALLCAAPTAVEIARGAVK